MSAQETTVWAAVYAAVIAAMASDTARWQEARARANVEAAWAVSKFREATP